MTYHIFIGADPREKEASQVCRYSIERFGNPDIKVHSLDTQSLRHSGLFTRPYHVTAEGQMVDDVDGRPFSTAFSFTRFLVPELWRSEPGKKSPLVMFVDSDFVFLENPENLFAEVEAQKQFTKGKFPVYVVKHNYKPTTEVKMDGVSQLAYNKKLWSALMVFDLSHPDNAALTAEVVNTSPGKHLHQFDWVKEQFAIGAIHEKWHFIPNHSEANISGRPFAVHYTNGGPWFPNYRNCRYAEVWLDMYNQYLQSTIASVIFNTDKLLF